MFTSGYDGLIYSIGFLVGWPIILFLIAERLRNLGKYTFADVASYRLGQKEIRTLSASGSLVVVAFYLIAQMVGAGKLIQLLFGLDYHVAVILVGILMCLYVLFGGMLATTWVQIIKAVLLLSGASFMALMVMKHVGFDFNTLFSEAIKVHAKGEAIMSPGGLVRTRFRRSPGSGADVRHCRPAAHPDALLHRQRRQGSAQERALRHRFHRLLLHPDLHHRLRRDPAGEHQPGLQGRCWRPDRRQQHGGGAPGQCRRRQRVLGFISAVAFATILAVVAGLTLAGASAVSHDLYASVWRKGKANDKDEIRVSKITTIALGVLAIGLGILFENQNIAFMVGLAFSIAASCNFPVLLLSMYWKKLTTRGAMIGGWMGLVSAVGLMILGPTIWVQILGHEKAIYPYEYPALFSMLIAFAGIWFFSVTDKSKAAEDERALFFPQFVRSQTGLGASGAVSH